MYSLKEDDGSYLIQSVETMSILSVHHISHRVAPSRWNGSRTQAQRVQHLFESGKLRRVGEGSELPDNEPSTISLAVVSTTTATLGSGMSTALVGQQARSAAGGLSDAASLIGTLDTLGMALRERHVDLEVRAGAVPGTLALPRSK